MTIYWKQEVTKPCWKLATLKKAPVARIIHENDIPDVAEYNFQPVNGKLTYMESKFGSLNWLEIVAYWLRGARTLEEMIREKYDLPYAHIKDLQVKPKQQV